MVIFLPGIFALWPLLACSAVLLSALASILSSVSASQFRQRERSASTAGTGAELQEPIPQIVPPGSNYQVFLSFRGEDTRKGFTDHLYKALVNAGICVFRDENNLCVGKEINPELLRAISESKVSIPIISRSYASSKWCLQELTQMIARKNNSGHMVMPILYKVEPSHVRNQTGSFGKAFDSLRKHSKPKDVEEWKQALKDVTSIKVWESEKIANGHEAELVKEVVEAVQSELEDDFQLDVIPNDLVGIDCHREKIMRFIDTNSSNTVMIGIYGMGGIGKTTFAKHIYNKLCKKFVYRSFITDIRQHDIQHSQSQLISDIAQRGQKVYRVDDGSNTIRSRFRSKQVLILLDDVDNEDQLDNLTREHIWFGFRSKIIVTTRDEGVLDRAKFGVDCKYELKTLDSQESLRLFSRHAFRSDSPSSEFRRLSSDVVATTRGLPLALKVIGSLLFGIRDHKIWEDKIKKLREAPEKEVQEKLKISYDELDYETQQIFLDIAYFFNNKEKTYPIYMWDGCNFAPRCGIHLLERRCLLRIEGGVFKMHDQLRDLGRAIIRQEDYNELKNRSRLWDDEEVLSILNRCEESEEIRAIDLFRVEPTTAVVFNEEQIEKLPKLRMLHVGQATFEGDFQNASFSELRWLRWWNNSTMLNWWNKCDLGNLHLEKLVILDLAFISISEGWTGWSSFKSLKVLDLLCCSALRTSPDLSACKSLETLSLQACFDLEIIHPSIGGMKTLVSLKLCGSKSVKELPIEISKLRELKELNINGTSIHEIPPWIVALKKLEKISARGCQLEEIPPSMGHLVDL